MQRRAIVWTWIFSCLLFLGFSDTVSAQQGTVTVSPSGAASPINFLNVPAGSTSSAQTVTVSTSVATTVTIQVSPSAQWLIVQPNGPVNVSSSSPLQLAVRANTTGLAQGSYQGTFTVTQAQNVVGTVFVNLTVSGSSLLSADPTSLTFNANQGATSGSPASTQVAISSSGSPLNYTISASTQDGHNWLLLSTTTGTSGGAAFSVSVNPTGLGVGTYNGTILVQSTTTQDSTSISVTLNVLANATLSITPSTLPPFLFQIGGAVPAAQTLQVNSSGGAVSFSVAQNPPVSWLILGTTGGTASNNQPVPINLTVNPAGLAAGTYQTQIVVTPFGGAALAPVTVSLVVSNNPLLKLQFNSINFSAQFAGAPPADQTVNITTTTGTGNVGFTFTSDQSWLTATASGNSTPATLTVHVNPAGLQVGNYTGNITVRPSNGDNYTQVLKVNLTIGNASQLTAGPPLLVFAFQTNMGNPQPQLVQLTTNGQPITFTISTATTQSANCPNNWINATGNSNTVSANTPVQLTVSVVTQGMTAGVCAGVVNVNYTSAGTAATLAIPVTVNVSASPELSIGLPVGFGNYTIQQGGSGTGTFIALGTTDNNLTSVSGSAVATSSVCPWLFASPGIFNTPTNISVQILPGCLTQPGMYSGTLTINSPSLPAAINIPVTLTITPNITVTASPVPPGPINFTEPQGGPPPASQTITLTSSAPGATFTASVTQITGGNWLQVTPNSGSANGTVTLTVLPAANSLPINTYPAQVTIAFQGSSTNAFVYNVNLNVVQAQSISVSPTGGLNFAYQIGGSVPAPQKLTISSTGGAVNFTVGTTTTSGNWLKADVTSGTTPKDVNISIDPTGLVPNNYQGTITINAPSVLANPIQIAVSLTVTAQPTPQPVTITNNASNLPGPIAPGELITIKGTQLGPTSPANGVLFTVNSQGKVDDTLAGVRVLFNGTRGTPIFVSANQINVIVPYDVSSFATVNLVVEFQGTQSAPFPVRVESTSPAIYTLNATGSGQAAAINQTGTFNGPPGSQTTPAQQDTVIAVYATGGGQSNPPSTNGSVTGFGTLLRVPGTVTATIGGVPALVEFAGEAPGIVTGVLQLNIRVPRGVSGNALPISFSINGVPSPAGPTVAVQ